MISKIRFSFVLHIAEKKRTWKTVDLFRSYLAEDRRILERERDKGISRERTFLYSCPSYSFTFSFLFSHSHPACYIALSFSLLFVPCCFHHPREYHSPFGRTIASNENFPSCKLQKFSYAYLLYNDP